ncbi:thioesterase II family protein [Paraherbaspirillum soli]|uniref:Thioesterase II family protein n=1 Tax=Paraherbaspirillum soli TaxID=631222 RepID=A0ABW0M8Y3_9BURK
MKRDANDAWFHVPIPRPEARLRLFCLPYAGASGVTFHHWAAAMPAHVELSGINLPGRLSRFAEPPFTRVEPLLAALDLALQTRDDLPYVLYGHSMGALLAFELAQLRVRSGAALPEHLIVSGRRAPGTSHRRQETYLLPDREFLAEVKSLNGLPSAAWDNAELIKLLLPMLRADFELVNTYTHVPRPPLPVPLTVLTGDADPVAPLEQVWAWDQQSTDCNVHVFEGDHFFIHQKEKEVVGMIADICTLNNVGRKSVAHSAALDASHTCGSSNGG